MYLSASCKHSRALLDVMERTGFADSYAFVNVDRERRLPRFVDRVPLLYDGNKVITDEALFDMFTNACASTDAPGTAGDCPIQAADSLCGSAFQTSYDVISNGTPVNQRDSCWRLDETHEQIVTPECQPMPSREQKKKDT